MSKKALGDWGEALTADHLRRQGYQILARQYRCRFGEVDLIAQKDRTVCFVEVKTRSGRTAGEAREAVTPAKQGRLRRAATWYLAQTGLDCPCRFDVAEVYPDPLWQRPRIHYISNAFQ